MAIINSTGNITNNRAIATAYRTGSVSVSNGANFIFDAKITDAGNNYNASTGVFTAPVTGKYLLTFSLSFNNSTASAIIADPAGLNIAVGAEGPASSGVSTPCTINFGFIYSMNSGQTISITNATGSTVTLNGGIATVVSWASFVQMA